MTLTQTLPHKALLTDLFGEEFWTEVIDRIVATTIYERDFAQRMLNECLAYLLARSKLNNRNAPLVANLLPDQAWHVFILYTREYEMFCKHIAGEYLHHDPAEEAALVNVRLATDRTVRIFETFGIEYDNSMWQDHLDFPNGASAIRTGVVAREATWLLRRVPHPAQ